MAAFEACVKTYRSKHAIEAMRWNYTASHCEAFAAWFKKHGTVFVTRAFKAVLPNGNTASEFDWILYADRKFIVMKDAVFTAHFEEIP